MNWYSTQQVAKKCGVSLRTAQRWAKNKDYQSFVRYHRGAYEFNEDFFVTLINNTTPNDNVAKGVASGVKPSNDTTQNDTTKRQETTSVASPNEWAELQKADEIVLPKEEYFELVQFIKDTSNYKAKYDELEKQSEARVQDFKDALNNAHNDIHYYRGQIAHLQGQMDKLLMSARERNLIDYTSLQKDINPVNTPPNTTTNDTQYDNVAEDVVLEETKKEPKTFVDFLNQQGRK
jgi:hypothetical protein